MNQGKCLLLALFLALAQNNRLFACPAPGSWGDGDDMGFGGSGGGCPIGPLLDEKEEKEEDSEEDEPEASFFPPPPPPPPASDPSDPQGDSEKKQDPVSNAPAPYFGGASGRDESGQDGFEAEPDPFDDSSGLAAAASEALSAIPKKAGKFLGFSWFKLWYERKREVSRILIRAMPDRYKASDDIYQKPMPVVKSYNLITNGPQSEMLVATLCEEVEASGVQAAEITNRCQSVIYDKAAFRF